LEHHGKDGILGKGGGEKKLDRSKEKGRRKKIPE